MSIDPTTTAVVLIEYQNDFTSDGGVLHPADPGRVLDVGLGWEHVVEATLLTFTLAALCGIALLLLGAFAVILVGMCRFLVRAAMGRGRGRPG